MAYEGGDRRKAALLWSVLDGEARLSQESDNVLNY